MRHPLVEVGFTKPEVRAAARDLGLAVWDKPSLACLGSRFAPGTRVTLDRVLRVARIERHLRGLGLRQFRVRVHGLERAPGEIRVPDGAGRPGEPGGDAGPAAGGPRTELLRIEVEVGDLDVLVRPGVRERLVATCKTEGFPWITLDLEGYRSGSTSVMTGPR